MKIFISQSGERSKQLALALQEFVRLVVLEAEPWVSHNGIEKGTRSLSKIGESLEAADAGIICLTSENLFAPWILFEAGALSKRQSDHVWTVLLDIDHTQVEPPLGQFQHTSVNKDDLRAVIQSINKASPKQRSEADLAKVFEAFWPDLGEKIESFVPPFPNHDPALFPVLTGHFDKILAPLLAEGRHRNANEIAIDRGIHAR